MPVMQIEVEVWCSCGEGLCNQSSIHRTGRGIEVEPCDKCLEKERKDGFDEGYEEGRTTEAEEEKS